MMKWLLIVKWVLNQNQITEDFRIETFSKASGGRRIPVKVVAVVIGQSNLRGKNQVQQFLMQVKEKWSKFIYVWVSDACHGTGLSRSVPRQQKQLERVLLLEVPRRQLPKSHCSPGEGHRDDIAEYVNDDNIVSNKRSFLEKVKHDIMACLCKMFKIYVS